MIATQKDRAKQYIFEKLTNALPEQTREKLNRLLTREGGGFTGLQFLKQPPGAASSSSMLRLIQKLKMIQGTGILVIDLSWLNNHYQRSLFRYVKRCSTNRLSKLQSNHRCAGLACFSWQTYRDTIDHIVEMYDKLISRVYKRAQNDLDVHTKERRKAV